MDKRTFEEVEDIGERLAGEIYLQRPSRRCFRPGTDPRTGHSDVGPGRKAISSQRGALRDGREWWWGDYFGRGRHLRLLKTCNNRIVRTLNAKCLK